jgi:squalene-associated FAD-dependent desaturase
VLKLAVIGAGWGGLAAAVEATRAGYEVTVFEAARTLGGRARSLEVRMPDESATVLDNGQHILVGAYLETLRMMEAVGVDPAAVLLRMPLTLRFPDGGGLALPQWPAPLDAVWGIARAKGWSVRDKLSLVRASLAWRSAGFECDASLSVAALCRDVTPRVMHEMIEPLCVSALNTPPECAGAQVFLRVLKDALFAAGSYRGWGGSNLLLPRAALGRLFPEAAQAWLPAQGAHVVAGHRVASIARAGDGWRVEGEAFDAVILACPVWEALRLVEGADVVADEWLARARALRHEAITTVYVAGGPALALPLLALRSSDEHPAQFVLDRSRLGGPEGLLAFVVSASQGDRESIERRVLAQAHSLGWKVEPVQTVVEKRATFACTPGLARPSIAIAPRLFACGDYVEGPYPATIEGAIRSALNAVEALRPATRRDP